MTRFTSTVTSTAHDVIDDEATTVQVTKKVSEHVRVAIEKVANDSRMTAGLATTISLAVGCRVMVRHNVNIEKGWVNGAIGTVVAIGTQNNRVQFVDVELDAKRTVERVKCVCAN